MNQIKKIQYAPIYMKKINSMKKLHLVHAYFLYVIHHAHNPCMIIYTHFLTTHTISTENFVQQSHL